MRNQTTIERVCSTLKRVLEDIQAGTNAVIVPPTPTDRPFPSGHFHSLPEIFVQIGGVTEFILPWTRLRLKANQACIIPAYVPHEERYAHEKTLFHYLVGMFTYETASWHESHLDKKNKLKSTPNAICRLQEGTRLVGLLEQAPLAANKTTPYAHLQQTGATLLAFAALLDAMENTDAPLQYEHPKVSFCKRVINDHLNRTELCVKFLAQQTDCSPNYLSSLFHQQTGIRLTDFINTRRLDQVKGLLLHSTMNVSEIAQTSGYSDPGYMSRIFVKRFGTTPRNYRAQSATST